MTEHTLQLQCIAYFRNEFERQGIGLIIPIINEATYKNKNFEICKGASDLIVIFNKKTIFIELKVGNNKQSPAQIEFEKKVTALGFEYWLVKSLEDFQKNINKIVFY